jgi:hypothetical protein
VSADNYLFVRKRSDGRFGISHRSASAYYLDEDGGDSVPADWFQPAPEDREGIFDTAEEAVMAAHKIESEMAVCEYGVSLGEGVRA